MANRKEWPLAVNLLLGIFAGAAYVAFDLVSEAKLRAGTLEGALASAHSIFDHLIPIVAGGLIGLSIHHSRLRARLAKAEESASRAEALRTRLLKVERDQAVWVVAAAVLHELNNPLHALGLLLDEYEACHGDDAQRAKLIERAHAQVRRALTQLDSLRGMQSAGEPEGQPFLLDRLIASLAEDASLLARTDGVQVRTLCESEVVVSADPSYVRTILENLLDNSLHSVRANAGGTVTIRLKKQADCAIVSIADDGPPLADGVRAALFDPLRTTKSQGLGLGLPIARALARAMHGELSLDAGAAKEFRLELPLGGPA
ncbi:MAG TPA: HAMP domain-containing sensor histidine kinase [Polyangiaceae bacterium]|nr:HAMP domain-containing sensor histidine kinase [Polyangiaceae bacterium]